ncbi:hypothetical protein OPV22_002521 [Ensete ventricosum]|uniref:Regulator of rDNA transcription protein 15 n=1 Tax=Ensete ventricosum TaxID=4639 RepID=A0AAV8RY30_ENSVE|nr:hypothetical protein OPV22_002516 [Ensete ventricosum]KAJ8512087.1 hypothetical protein OPV22_002521 [Ensete ventricosum]
MPAAGIALAPGLCKSALGDGTPTRNACCRHCARAWIMQICTWRRDAHSQCLLQKRSRLNSANLHLKRSRLKSANLHCATAAAALLIWGDGRPLTRKRLLVLNLRRCCCALAPAIAACALASQIAAGHSHSEHASVSNKNKQPASQSSTGGGHIANERMSLCNLAFTEGSCFGGDESVRRRAGSQWIVAARPLYHLQCPIAYLSRLQRIRPVVRAEFHFPMATRGRTTTGATPATRAHGGRRPLLSKGSIGHAFTVRIRTGNQNQTSFYPFVPHEISVLVELILGHLRYLLTDVPPQPNSPPDNVFRPDRPARQALGPKGGAGPRLRLTE